MKKSAFTLVEILIVVMVFWVGILAVLKLLTNSLGYFDAISMRTKATLLAKEGIEIAYGFRDSNIEQGYPWNYLEKEKTESYLWTGGNTLFKVWFTGGQAYWDFEPLETTELNFEETFNQFYLELYTGDTNKIAYYHHSQQSELPAKGFARIITFTPIKEWETTLDINKILKVTSRVLYKRWSSTGEVVLESFIGMRDSLPAEN